MRILIVEDTEDSRVLLEDIIKASGYNVDSAINGVDALEKAKQAPPDMIVSDILMPEMDGFELCREVKRHPQLRKIPFVFYSATYTSSEDEEFALTLGASKFVIKPEDPVKLISIIEDVWAQYSEGKKIELGPSEDDEVLEKRHIKVVNKKLNAKILELEIQKEKLKLAALVFNNSSEGMIVADDENLIIETNPAFSVITGYSLDEVKGRPPSFLSSGYHDSTFYEEMWHQLNNTGTWQGEVRDKHKNGDIYTQWLTINIIRNDDDSVKQYVAIFSDISEKKKSEELIWRQANFDALTELPNRNMFRNKLKQSLELSNRDNQTLAMLLVDLDLFKEVNDTLGHDVGDVLLQEATHRIRQCVGKSYIVARMGGDEFSIIMTNVIGKSQTDEVAKKIVSELAIPFHINNEIVHVSGSVGVTLYPNDADNIDTLIKNADQAMYAAKEKGRNGFSYFTQSLQDAAQEKLKLTTALRVALIKKQFSVYFQPIINLETKSICKAEALLRWHHPERGMVSPLEFIPLAEETGLINEIGDWVFKESARWIKHWNSRFNLDCQVSVNMSPVQFGIGNDIFIDEWLEYLKEIDLSGKHMIVEITENLLLNAESTVKDKLYALRNTGIQIAIDDFGTGYSSLSYLKKFDIDYLKIDQSFIQNIETGKNDMALSEAIIVMAHKLELEVIAEGVETEGQKKLLAEANCNFLQGYLYSKPVPAEEFEILLEREQVT